MKGPLVSCVTVTYGPTASLRPMLESLERTTRYGEVEVFVVTQPDSTGCSERGIGSSHPRITEVDLADNIGFGPANNLAVARTRAPLIALLNPDLVLTEHWLEPLVAALGDQSVTIVSPPLLTPMGELDEAGQIIYVDGGSEPFGRGGFAAPYERLMFSRDVDYASAACWLMRRADFDALGGFAPDYAPAYFEDVDLAFRARKNGGRCRLVTSRPVIHDHSPPTTERMRMATRSREIFRGKWATELERQPVRSLDRADCARVRDHRCDETRLVEISRRMPTAEAAAVIDEAGLWAEAHPTSRMTVRVDRRPEVEGWRRKWCPRGLEIVIDPS